jgi:hypothetical protein
VEGVGTFSTGARVRRCDEVKASIRPTTRELKTKIMVQLIKGNLSRIKGRRGGNRIRVP